VFAKGVTVDVVRARTGHGVGGEAFLLVIVPDFTYSVIYSFKYIVHYDDKIGWEVSVNSIFRTCLRWLMEVVSGIMRIVVPIPPTHPRRATSLLTIGDIEITVRVDTDL